MLLGEKVVYATDPEDAANKVVELSDFTLVTHIIRSPLGDFDADAILIDEQDIIEIEGD